jgi:drug/metabolite transporter (DMT)-like permease
MAARSASRRGVFLGLAAALSFGISAPLAKRLLDDTSAQMLAGLLYLGAFIALSLAGPRSRSEARLRRADAPRMTVMIAAGGVVAPVLLLLGLERVSGVAGSLLLNLEGPLTIVVGVMLFREHLPRQAITGALVIFAGAFVLGVGTGETRADWLGILLIAAACAGWAVDNNLTQSLTVRDPRSIVRVKTGVAGTVNVVLAVIIGEHLPQAVLLVVALLLGAVSYGLSIYLDALALRSLGAAREAAVFSVAPFVGALLAPLVLPESLAIRDFAAGALMAFGVALLLRERHEHVHRHEPLDHDHVHVHDEHHQHAHEGGVSEDEPHSHAHHHDELVHPHPHVSDVHHRHSHSDASTGSEQGRGSRVWKWRVWNLIAVPMPIFLGARTACCRRGP